MLKAREINPSLPDRMRVFIINKKNQDSVIKQLEAIDKLEKITQRHQDNQSTSEIHNIEDIKTANLSAKLEDSQQAIISELNSLKDAILDNIDDKIPKPLPLLDAFNQILDDQVSDLVIKKLSFLGKKKAKKIADKLREYKKINQTEFKTFQAVLDEGLGKGYISKEKLLEVIDNWN